MQNEAKNNLEQELLLQLSEQVKRSPVPVVLSMALVAFMAAQYVSAWYWGTWLVLVIAAQIVRWVLFRQIPEQTHIPTEQRLRTAGMINLVSTLLHTGSLVWFPLFSPYQCAVQSILFIGMGSGSVMMSAGYTPFARAFTLYSLLPLFFLWVWSGLFGPGGNIALFVGLIGFGYSALILRIAAYIFKLYADSFEVRQQLEVALVQAETAGRAKTRFLAAASHDLRQPMHALSLFSAALATHKLEEDTSQLVDNINTAVEALSYELDGLLDISKLDAGIVPVNRSDFCLVMLLRRLCEEFSQQAQKRDVNISLDCPERAIANTDSILLERIIRNLATNAIHHNAQCDLIFQLVHADDSWQLTVSDTGRGIAPEQHDHIFEEFYQLENVERDRTKGLGLGLSIVRRLSELLGLGMTFESAPGVGTQFRFSIAAADQPAGEVAVHSVGQPQQLPDALIVLLVDDELSVLEGMQAILSSLGCEVITADSSDTAVSAATALKPDIALVDLRLRDHDTGLITIDRLRSIYPQLPAIIISGDTAPDRLLEIDKRNIPVLTKPVNVGPLTAAILEQCV